MKKKNGFTLIELLAILVILAIIAVITIPKINKVINESKQNAARNSAYGYKDAIEKWQTTQFEVEDIYLDGSYRVLNGKLDNYTIPITGSAPSSGYLTYEDDDLISGCLVINGYEAIYQNGKFTSNGKGDCGGVTPSIPTIPSCPGCVFAYTLDELTLGTSTVPEGASNDYTTLTNEHPYFFGFIANSNTNIIERVFVCGIEDGTPFCLEGYDTSKYSNNVNVLNSIFSGCNASASDESAECNGSSVSAVANNHGGIVVSSNNAGFIVYDSGKTGHYNGR